MGSMWIKFMRVAAPFTHIARELSIIRELYEADLASRHPPVVRITETPKKSDTEVTYMEDHPKKTVKDRLAQLLGGDEDDEDAATDE
jgi:hypothetical protein